MKFFLAYLRNMFHHEGKEKDLTNSTQRVQKYRAKVRREKALRENGVVHFSAWVLETDLPALQKYADNPEVVKLLEEWEKEND